MRFQKRSLLSSDISAAIGFDYNLYYDVKPDLNKCQPGTLKPSVNQDALARVNYLRSLHGLPPVLYKALDDVFTRQASLISATNKELTHSPAIASNCYSNDGAIGCQTSILSGGNVGNENNIPSTNLTVDRRLTEINNSTAVIGHRRWLLNPFQKYISYGRVDGKRGGKNSDLGQWLRYKRIHVLQIYTCSGV